MGLLSLIKQLLYRLGHGFVQLLLIVFIGLPAVVLMLIFPALRRKLMSGNIRYEDLSATALLKNPHLFKAKKAHDPDTPS